MKLFIFEGKREPQVFDTLEKLFFESKETDQRVVCCYNSNIYSLYQHYMRYDGGANIVTVLQEVMQGRNDNPFTDEMLVSDFGEIYLFFDYDFHDSHFTLEEINQHLKEMLQIFDNETENGKLYISYPMIEALRYTKCMPDKDYSKYIVDRSGSHDFKRIAADFSHYKDGWDFITLNDNTTKEKMATVHQNWKLSTFQNVIKANLLCEGEEKIPSSNEVVSQERIFQCQIDDFVIPYNSVSILSAFSMFLFEYFGESIINI